MKGSAKGSGRSPAACIAENQRAQEQAVPNSRRRERRLITNVSSSNSPDSGMAGAHRPSSLPWQNSAASRELSAPFPDASVAVFSNPVPRCGSALWPSCTHKGLWVLYLQLFKHLPKPPVTSPSAAASRRWGQRHRGLVGFVPQQKAPGPAQNLLHTHTQTSSFQISPQTCSFFNPKIWVPKTVTSYSLSGEFLITACCIETCSICSRVPF